MQFRSIALFAILAVVALNGVSAGFTRWHEIEAKEYDFEQYVSEFRKPHVPGTPMYETRKAIFNNNLRTIKEHNAKGLSYKYGVSHLTDLTTEEFKQMLGHRPSINQAMAKMNIPHRQENAFAKASLHGLPSRVDWREKGAVTPVKDQGQCGSCWTFAAAETLESQLFISQGISVELSEQQIASCTSNPKHCGGTGGCSGGTAEIAYDSIVTNGGLSSEWVYPYVSHAGKNFDCNSDLIVPFAKISGYTKLANNSYPALMQAVASVGPIAVSVDASAWHFYETGVFSGCNMQQPDIDHAVQLVGYGEDNGELYYLVRNSWTPTWGESGYIRIQRTEGDQTCGVDTTPQDGSGCDGDGPQTVCGMCGILSDSCYPNVSK